MRLATLRGILVAAFSVSQSLVVPKQGNYWSAMDLDSTVATWVAFMLRNPRVRTRYMQNDPASPTSSPSSVTVYTGKLEMQFVGVNSENLAYSVGHWMNRPDVIALFGAQNCQIMGDEMGSIIVTDFAQDGNNTVLAYNLSIGLQWVDVIQSTNTQLTIADLQGVVS